MFGWLDRLGGKKRMAERARKKELRGDVDHAVQLFLDAELPDEAARVLMLKADAELDATRRMALCAQAARLGNGPHGESARRRKALLSFDLLKDVGGARLHGELARIATELDEAGSWQEAAEAYAMLGDAESEIRVLKEAGAIGRLEARLRETSESARRDRDRKALLLRLTDLDAIAERREALRNADAWLEQDNDEQVELWVQRIRGRLLEGPVIDLEVSGDRARYVLGTSVTIGRARADITVASTGISRQHLRLYRDGGVPFVEDLETRNGTTLAGARIRGALAIGDGVSLQLANQVPCRVAPSRHDAAGPLEVDIGGESYRVPLGPLRIGGWQIIDAHDDADRFVVLRTLDGDPPFMAGLRLAKRIELCIGDELSADRDADANLRVPRQPSMRRGTV